MAIIADTIETEILLKRDALSPALQKILGLAGLTEAKLRQLSAAAGMVRLPAKFMSELAGASGAAGKLRDTLGTIKLSTAATTEAGTLSRALGVAETRAAMLSRTLSTLRMPHLAPVPGTGGAGGGGHGGGGMRGRWHAGPVGGHFGVGPGTAAGLGLGFGAYEGVKLAAKEQLGYMYAVLASGMDPTSPKGQSYMKRLRSVAEDASFGTVFTRAEVAKMMPGIAGMSDVPLDLALPFMKPAIQFGEVERQFGSAIGKTFSPIESAAAAIRMSHMLGITDPDKMTPVLNAMVPATTTTEKSPEELTRVLQYMLGSAAGVGMSQAESINLGALGGILMPGTRAGTSLNMMLTGMMPKGGAGAGTKIHRGAAQRNAMLQKMGLIDPSTHQLYRDEQGGMLVPMIEHLQSYLKTHPTTAYGDFVGAFQQRGARMAFELARNDKMVDMARELQTRQTNFTGMGGVAGAQGKQNEALANQSLRAWSNLRTIATDLAEGTVPGLTSALKGLNTGMEATRSFLDSHKGVATAAGYGAEALGAYAGWRVLRKTLGWFGGGAAGAAPDMVALAGAAGRAAGAVGLLVSRLNAIGAFLATMSPTEANKGEKEAIDKARGSLFPNLPAGIGVDKLSPEQAKQLLGTAYGLSDAMRAALQQRSNLGFMPPGTDFPIPGASLGKQSSLLDRFNPISSAHAAEMPSLAGPGGGGDMAAAGAQFGQAAVAQINGAIQAMAVTLNGQVNLAGDVHLTAPGLFEAVGRMLAQGIAHAMGGALTSGPAREHLSGGPALQPPT
jgi:hypothetical protein